MTTKGIRNAIIGAHQNSHTVKTNVDAHDGMRMVGYVCLQAHREGQKRQVARQLLP